MTLTAYRLCPRSQADSGRAFLGEGARLAGGRWNPPGIAVVYAAGALSLACLELLVHFESLDDLPPLAFFRLQFDASLMLPVPPLPPDWGALPASASTRRLGAAWVREGGSVVLQVPSVIIPTEHNFVLNPAHPDFNRIQISPAQAFALDPRLVAGG